MKSASEKMYKVLESLIGRARLDAIREHTGFRFEAAGLMPLSVDVWRELRDGKDTLVLAVAHNYEQNGDLMADPDMEFYLTEGCALVSKAGVFSYESRRALSPVHYQQDGLGIFQRAQYWENGKHFHSPSLLTELCHFADGWARNIEQQGYKEVKTG